MWTIYRSDSDPISGFKYEEDTRRAVRLMGNVERLGIYSWAIEDQPGHNITARIQHTPQRGRRR